MAKEKKEFVEHITSQSEDFSRWYTDVIMKADMVDYSEVKGCMVIKPLWLRHLGAHSERDGRAF